MLAVSPIEEVRSEIKKFGIHDPLRPAGFAQQVCKGAWCGEIADLAWKPQLPGVEGLLERFEKLTAESGAVCYGESAAIQNRSRAAIGIPTGVTLVGVSGNYTGIINSISFLFSDGTSAGPFGSVGGDIPGDSNAFTLTVPKGSNLTGVFGVHGDSNGQVNSLGLVFFPGVS